MSTLKEFNESLARFEAQCVKCKNTYHRVLIDRRGYCLKCADLNSIGSIVWPERKKRKKRK